MPVVYARNFATGTQQYLSLSAADYMRTLSIGSNWNRLRIGILCAITPPGETTWNITGNNLALGMCAGYGSSLTTQAPAHVFGAALPNVPANISVQSVINYAAGSGGNTYYTSGGQVFFKYEKGVIGTSVTGSFTWNIPSCAQSGIARRGILILEMVKSALIAGNMTFALYGDTAALTAVDVTSSDLYTALESSAPAVQGITLTSLGVGNTIAFNEITNGFLDTVFVQWGGYINPLQLYEIAVMRVG